MKSKKKYMGSLAGASNMSILSGDGRNLGLYCQLGKILKSNPLSLGAILSLKKQMPNGDTLPVLSVTLSYILVGLVVADCAA